jgi:tetratricopeptide (TPR) repeat protein
MNKETDKGCNYLSLNLVFWHFNNSYKFNMMKSTLLVTFSIVALLSWAELNSLQAQALKIPQKQNYPASISHELGVTEIEIDWHAPGVKGREGKIWGTPIAHYGYTVLGFGSDVESPWRAGADECTTISFSTDVKVNGKTLAAGKYAFFIALYPDSSVLIFNKNVDAWGSYFYDKNLDVLKVTTIQQKKQSHMQERLKYVIDQQKEAAVEVALLWEYWKIPFTVEVDYKQTVLASIKQQMSGELAFDPPSLTAAATWCLINDINLPEALKWINLALNPAFGGTPTFNTLSTKAELLKKNGQQTESTATMQEAFDLASAIELHGYGRQLIGENKPKEALAIFEKNHKKHQGAWPTNVGMMRGYSANGDYKKALEFAKLALPQAPDDLNKQSLAEAIKKLEAGKPL